MSQQGQSLKTRLLKAGGWVLGGFVAGQVVRLVGNLVLTRLLFPEAFGLMAVVYVLMVGLALVSDLGINQGIIRNPRGEEMDYLNTAWTIQILRGLLISILTLAIAFAISVASDHGWVPADSVYSDATLPWIISAFSLTALIQGFESTKVALASRRLQLGALVKIELLSQCVALVVMLGIAWVYHSIWALVAGGIVSALVKCIAGHILLAGLPSRLRWEPSSANEILHFGKWIFASSILGFLSINGDRLILADLVDATTLGIYSIAFLLVNMVTMIFNTMLAKAVYPALGEVVRVRPDDVFRVYNKLQMAADVFLFGSAGLLFVLGSHVVELLYDDRYHQAGPMLEILSLGLIGLRYSVVEQYCIAVGAMRFLMISNVCRLLALFVGLPVGYKLAGMDGGLIAIVASQFAAWPVAFHFKIRQRMSSWKSELVGIPVFAIAVITASLGLQWLL